MVTTLVYRNNLLAAENPPATQLAALRAEPGIFLWVDLSEPDEAEITLLLELVFQFHPLAIEACVNDTPFPKVEDYDDYLHLVMHAVDYTRDEHFTTTEVNLLLSKTFLVTFHRKALRPVQVTLERYQRSPGTLVRGPDRFAHHLLDQMVEAYRPALEELQKDLDILEADALRAVIPAKELFPRLLALRKEFASLRAIVRPQKDIATELAQGKNRHIRPVIVPYLRDLAEELGRIELQSESWTDRLMLAFRVYLNKSTNEANAGIKVLTAITALTIPVLAVGGWYGMNFKPMPELARSLAYPLTLVLVLAGTGLVYFLIRRKHWF